MAPIAQVGLQRFADVVVGWDACGLFERFTAQARDVVVGAQEDARELGHPWIGSEHMLLALTRADSEIVVEVFAELGITDAVVRDQVLDRLGTGSGRPTEGWMRFSAMAKRVMERSLREALSTGRREVGPEAVLLAITRVDESGAVGILDGLGASTDQIRVAVRQRIPGPVAGTPIVADTGNGDASATVSPALLEMFTEAARQVVVLADREARAIPFSHIGSEHLLIGMVDERDGLAAQALRRLGVDSNLVRARMHLHISPSDRAPEGELPLTPKALEVLEAARRQAERRELNFIGTEHLLLGLTVVASGLAVRILEELGVSVEQLAEALQGVLGIARGRLSWMVQQSNGAQVRGVLGAGWIDVLSLGPSIHLRRLLGRAPIRPAATGRGVLELDDLVTAFIELPQCAQLLSELGLKAEPIVSAAPGPSGGSWAQIDASEQVVAVLLAAAAHTVEDQRELVTLGDLLLALADNDSATLAARGLDPDAVREALRRRGRDDPA